LKILRTFTHILVILLFSAATGFAVVLDWGNLPGGATWADGATTGSFNTDLENPGNDITVTVTKTAGVSFTADFPKNAADDGVSVIGNNDASTLHLRVPTFVDHVNTITVTITFNYAAGVRNAAFNLIDIDATTNNTGWIDGIKNISATNLANTAVAMSATSVNGTVTTVSGSGTLGMTVQGNTGAGNINDHSGDVNFTSGGVNAIKSLTFQWYNPDPGELGGQVISLGNVSYTPVVPEVGSSLGAIALWLGLVAFWRRRPAARIV
jgi:hypothetical protein